MKTKFKHCIEMKREGASREAMIAEGKAIFAAMDRIMDDCKIADRDLTADERREYDRLEKLLDSYVGEVGVESPGICATDPVSAESGRYRDGQPLAQGQSFAGFAQAMGHPGAGFDEAPLSLGKYIRGAFTGDWRGAEDEKIMAALSGASAGAGGVTIPTVLTTRIIDLARAKTRVMQAGATTVPMESRTVDVARWLSDPTPGWRVENAAIPESDATLDKVTLTAKSLAVVTKVSRELIEDTNIEDQLVAAFAAAFALKLDAASLYGDGTSGAPTGVKNTAAVTKTPLATNGATPTWATLVNSVGRLRDQNEEPTAQILADRTARSLALVTGSDGQYMNAPSYLDGVDRLTTNQVPTAMTVGTSTDTSDVFTADWSQLYLGIRTQLQITILQERFMPDAGQYGFVAWWRGDVAIARPKAFDVVTGVRP